MSNHQEEAGILLPGERNVYEVSDRTATLIECLTLVNSAFSKVKRVLSSEAKQDPDISDSFNDTLMVITTLIGGSITKNQTNNQNVI